MRLQDPKLFRFLNKCFFIKKQNGVLMQNLLFLSAGVFPMHIFQVAFHDFQQESGFLALLMVEKEQGAFVTSEKRAG